MRSLLLGAGVVLAWSLGAAAAHAAAPSPATPTSKLLQRDILTNADLWERRPRMMAAGLGFTGIIGVPGLNGADLPASEAAVRAAGGTWNTVSCGTGATPALTAFTSASSPQNVAVAYGRPVTDADGLPVEFSWPLRPSTVGPTDFRVTLNTGERVTPLAASVYPNAEENERSVAVLFGRFGNRLAAGTPGARYVVRTEVVRDATPLQLVGTGGRIVSALGMAATIRTSPYGDPDAAPADRTGPRLVAAKVSRLSTRGETAPAPFDGALPNDGRTLYGDAARFRIRVFTTGGFSPDGVRAVFPTEFARYFRLRARAGHGRTVALTRTGRTTGWEATPSAFWDSRTSVAARTPTTTATPRTRTTRSTSCWRATSGRCAGSRTWRSPPTGCTAASTTRGRATRPRPGPVHRARADPGPADHRCAAGAADGHLARVTAAAGRAMRCAAAATPGHRRVHPGEVPGAEAVAAGDHQPPSPGGRRTRRARDATGSRTASA